MWETRLHLDLVPDAIPKPWLASLQIHTSVAFNFYRQQMLQPVELLGCMLNSIL